MEPKYHNAVGPCPICGKKDPWLNNIPLTAYCWGSDENPHKEVRRVVPDPAQPYGSVGQETEWRYANNLRVKPKK